jgi:hypothetical protein
VWVPEALSDVPPVLTKEQEAAKRLATQNYLKAKELRDMHEKLVAKSAMDMEKLRKATPTNVNKLQSTLNDLAIQRAEIEQRLKAKTPQTSAIDKVIKNVPYGEEAVNALGKVNEFINKTPGLKYAVPALSGGLGAAQLTSGMQHYGEGNKLKGALEMMSGAGGVIGAFPHPYTRAAGLALQAPYMGYEGAEYVHDKLYPPK